ncbi:hypothetical protein MTO96_001021 [Rhipicephalus appendiculatus]
MQPSGLARAVALSTRKNETSEVYQDASPLFLLRATPLERMPPRMHRVDALSLAASARAIAAGKGEHRKPGEGAPGFAPPLMRRRLRVRDGGPSDPLAVNSRRPINEPAARWTPTRVRPATRWKQTYPVSLGVR